MLMDSHAKNRVFKAIYIAQYDLLKKYKVSKPARTLVELLD